MCAGASCIWVISVLSQLTLLITGNPGVPGDVHPDGAEAVQRDVAPARGTHHPGDGVRARAHAQVLRYAPKCGAGNSVFVFTP